MVKLSPLSFTFRHVKGHQTKLVAYNQLDWWGQRNKDVDGMAKDFLFTCTEGSHLDRRDYTQPILHLEKWGLSRDGTKFTSVCRDSLYTNLYGSGTLAFWAKKDHTPKDPKRILWEESLSAYKECPDLNEGLTQNYCATAVVLSTESSAEENKILILAQPVVSLMKIATICLPVKRQIQ